MSDIEVVGTLYEWGMDVGFGKVVQCSRFITTGESGKGLTGREKSTPLCRLSDHEAVMQAKEKEIAILKTALDFYADNKNWSQSKYEEGSEIDQDQGMTATDALAAYRAGGADGK